MGKVSAVISSNARTLLLVTALMALFSRAHAQGDTVLERYRKYLFDEPRSRIKEMIASYDTVRQWPDIDYADKQPANWKLLDHLKRVRDIALDWTDPRSKDYHDPVSWRTINAALNYWLEKRPKNANWWHNQIGVPQYMRDIIVLLRDALTKDQWTQCMEVLGQYKLQKNGEGANLVWSADLGLHYAALSGNDSLAKRCVGLIVNEINITTGDGIQPDHSFHQHGARLQMYQYGAAFLYSSVRLAWQLRGTPWAYPQEKLDILADFVLKGWQWMARGIHTVPGTIDRSVSRVDALHGADIRRLIPYLCELFPKEKNDFLAVSARQDGKGVPLEGFRYFPYSDFAVYQQKGFSFFIKTISSRTLATEHINNENLKGHLLNSGDAYIIRDGREYFNLMPCWDWDLLPGVTGFEGADQVLRRPFCGSVSNGESGATVMDYSLQGKNGQSIGARKLWACHDGMVVCLIGGLTGKGLADDAYTALNQCRWRGDVTSNVQQGKFSAGKHSLQGVRWIHHDGMAYIFLQPTEVELRLETVTGSWRSINASGPGQPVKERVFLPVMKHPLPSGPVSTGYVITSCATPARAQALSAKPEWKIIANDTVCQAILFSDGTLMAAFFAAGSLVVDGRKLEADGPRLLMIQDGRTYEGDPSQGPVANRHPVGNRSMDSQPFSSPPAPPHPAYAAGRGQDYITHLRWR